MTLRELGEHIEQYFIEIIRERRKAPLDSFVKGLLFIASRFYLRAINIRTWMYDTRIIRNRAIGCLVVSIGNLTCGGTGKTPIVEIFARTLSQKGRKVAVLSRGYRSRDKRSFLEKLKKRLFSQKMEVPPRVVSDGKNLLHDSITAGDEPYMLASNLKNVAVLVDKDRVKSGLYAIDEFGTDVLILDDGFQYLRLKAHINIVLVDSTAPFDNIPSAQWRLKGETSKFSSSCDWTRAANREVAKFICCLEIPSSAADNSIGIPSDSLGRVKTISRNPAAEAPSYFKTPFT